MKTSSAKAKGRRLQQRVAKRIQDFYLLASTEVKSLPMGAQGLDVWLSGEARRKFPFGIECKNVQKINIWDSWKQTVTNAEKEQLPPALVFSRNNEEDLVVLRLEDLLMFGKYR